MQTQTAIPTELPPMGSLTPQQSATKSQTHWVWTPYKDITNMGPFGINSQLGYRDQRWAELKRCVPYPLGNLISYETDRSIAAEQSTSMLLDAESLPKIEYVKYARDQAVELTDNYKDVGLRILIPLMGMNDPELVNQIVQTVQPFQYLIHEMAYEFSEGAEKRIRKSNLSDEDKDKARELAKIMLNGSRDAETKGLAEYEALISSMSDKMAGQPGIANPTKFHEWICRQLDKPVPARIDRTGGQTNQSTAIDILAKRALQEESAAESMAAQLAEERAARLRLEKQVAELAAQQETSKSGKQARV